MLRQELQQELLQSRETLAARNAEVDELKARVADLERLQAQQAQLIQLKDSELASAQERLATTASAPAPAAEATAQEGGGLPWLWIGAGLLLVAVVAWLLARRTPKPAPRPRFGTPRELPPAAAGASVAGTSGPSAPVAGDVADAASVPPLPATPAWHAGLPAAAVSARAADEPPGDLAGDPAATAPPGVVLEPGQGVERIELARAYLDLGDVETARDLLREVAEAGEPSARAEASRLLEGIA